MSGRTTPSSNGGKKCDSKESAFSFSRVHLLQDFFISAFTTSLQVKGGPYSIVDQKYIGIPYTYSVSGKTVYFLGKWNGKKLFLTTTTTGESSALFESILMIRKINTT